MRATITLLFWCTAVFGFAQNEIDAVRLTQAGLHGSARYVGLGGAMSAVGGDFSTLNINPAGLGILRSNEIGGSVGVNILGSTATHYGNEKYSSVSRLSIDHLGMGGPSNAALKGKWSNLVLGLSYNRRGNFHRQIELEGINSESSLLDAFQNLLNTNNGQYDFNNPPSSYPYSVDLAWETLLIDTFQNSYYTQIFKKNTLQTKRISRSGSWSELSLAASAHYNYKWYVGASLNIQNYEFNEVNYFTETVSEADTITNLLGYNFEESLTVSAGGANLNIGFIYRASDYIRIGGSVKTPTLFNLTDNFDAVMQANYNAGTFEAIPQAPIYFEYRFFGPWRATLGAAAFFGKSGLFSVDYEFVDFAQGRFGEKRGYNFSTDGLNNNINQNLNITHTIRAGAEYRLGNYFLRSGYVFSQNPYNNNLAINNKFTSTTFGIGYRAEGWYFDTTFQSINFEEFDYYLYNPELAQIQPTKIENRDFKLLFTFGIRY